MRKFQAQFKNILYLLLALAAVAIVVSGNLQLGDDGSEECLQHLKDTATQIEVFSIDYQGRIPNDWSEIIPDYLREKPKCPIDDRSHYSLSRSKAELEDIPESFQYYKISCDSPRHRRVLTYDNIQGEG
mgnify:CR=1 FL=1